MTDPFVGSLTFVRVYSGTIAAGTYVMNGNKGRRSALAASWKCMPTRGRISRWQDGGHHCHCWPEGEPFWTKVAPPRMLTFQADWNIGNCSGRERSNVLQSVSDVDYMHCPYVQDSITWMSDSAIPIPPSPIERRDSSRACSLGKPIPPILEAKHGYILPLYSFVQDTIRGETLCDPEKPVVLERMDFPDPVIKVAIEPKTKADVDKMANGLIKLAQEDPSFHFSRDEETNQTVIEGMGELHLEIIVDRLSASSRYGTIGPP